jgi:trimeric autotransporter adhesin
MKLRIGCVIVGILSLVLPLAAQTAGNSPAAAQVPSLVNFSGVLADVKGKPLTGVVGVTFSLYQEQQGGSPLWLETQNVEAGKAGNYTVALGSTSSQGLPAHVFAMGEARWLGVQVQGQAEQPRVLLMSVPYALKALDAQTIGGLPPSAFVLAAPPSGSASASAKDSATAPGAPPPSSPVTGTGTQNFVPLWDSTSDIIKSALFQSGTGSTAKIGINTITPSATLDVNGGANVRVALNLPATGAATAGGGRTSPTLNFAASSFNSNTASAVNETFRLKAEPTGNNTASPSGTLNLLFGSGTAAPAETGLSIASNGQVTFAAGQTFPGSGTITGVVAGVGLTGGGLSGKVTLNLDTTKVPQLNTANTFTANQTVNGSVTATSFSGNGASLTNVNAALLGGVGASAFAQLAANNIFTGSEQRFNNSVIVGPINSFTEGQLAAGATEANNPAFGAAGFTVASGSDLDGGDGIVSFAGSGDTTTIFNTGGTGVFGRGGDGFNGGIGVSGFGGSGGPCCIGSKDGVGGFFEGASNSFLDGDGVFGLTGSGFAGNFEGSVNVTGTITSGAKDLKIDDPLDPANKYLTHSSVESSEMMNIYTGNVTTDGQGNATVPLPNWFEVLNTDFRYQLTVIGQFAQAIVAREIQNGEFAIRTSVPNVKVSWLVTGVRQDAFAKAHPLVVEQEKEARLRGFYIHPELYGAAEEKQIEWARHPQMMRQAKERRLHPHQAVKGGRLAQSLQPSR